MRYVIILLATCALVACSPQTRVRTTVAGNDSKKIKAMASSNVRASADVKRARLVAYVSPSRGAAWYLAEGESEFMKRKPADVARSHRVESAEMLEMLASILEARPGDGTLWFNASCNGYFGGCAIQCEYLGSGLYYSASGQPRNYCEYDPGRYCYQTLQGICDFHYFYDSSCSNEIPDTAFTAYDWVCSP